MYMCGNSKHHNKHFMRISWGYILGICSIFYQTEFYLPLGKNKDSPHAKQQWFLLETDQMMDGLVFHVFFTGKNNKM